MIILLALTTLIAAEVLDFDMTTQERKKTGVYKLTSREKAALKLWIDTHYEKREAPLHQEDNNRSMLQEVLFRGQYVKLTNGTIWNIAPEDTNISQSWITAVDIIVAKSDDEEYPYRLTNSLTGSTIRARKADKLPSKQENPIENSVGN